MPAEVHTLALSNLTWVTPPQPIKGSPNLEVLPNIRLHTEELLGFGQWGYVYGGTDLRDGASVAVKIYYNSWEAPHFRREVNAARMLQSPGFPILREQGVVGKMTPCPDLRFLEEGCRYIVWNRVPGQNLETAVINFANQYDSLRGVLSLRDGVAVTLALLPLLRRCHEKNLVHADVRAANVMLSPGYRVTLMDFGCAVPVNGRPADEHDRFSAPPEIRGGIVTPATDLHMLSGMLFRLLTAHAPMDGKGNWIGPARQIRPELPDALDRLFARALQPRQELRFRNAAELGAELRPFLRLEGGDTRTLIGVG